MSDPREPLEADAEDNLNRTLTIITISIAVGAVIIVALAFLVAKLV